MSNKSLAIAALALAPAFQAQAALVSYDTNKILDTDTNLVWHKVTETAGLSYNALTPLFADGQQYDGFQHATNAEVHTLFLHAGINPNDFSFDSAQLTAVQAFQDLFGSVVDGTGTVHTTSGITEDNIAGLHDFAYLQRNSGFTYNGVPIGFTANEDQSVAGHWIRTEQQVSSVPEPGSLALLAAGLGVAGLASRRRTPAPR